MYCMEITIKEFPLKLFLALFARVVIVSTIQKAVNPILTLPVDNLIIKTSWILRGLDKAKHGYFANVAFSDLTHFSTRVK